MPKLPESVQPGDIISAELMTAILTELANISSPEPPGTQVVPSVFGTRLIDARTAITQPSLQLSMGFVIDVTGAVVDPLASANINRIVINQSPDAETRVVPNTPVNLVVSLTAVNSELPPTISHTETPTGTTTASFPVDATMVIVGTNFSAIASQNTVQFDGTPASVSSDAVDPTRRLHVVVPTGIPDAPVNPGDSSKSGVVVSVNTLASESASTTITVTAPFAGQHTIETVNPAIQLEGGLITITGVNYTTSAQVLIRDVSAVIESQSPTQIVARVPDFNDINPGPAVGASLVISKPDASDVSFSGNFRVIGV